MQQCHEITEPELQTITMTLAEYEELARQNSKLKRYKRNAKKAYKDLQAAYERNLRRVVLWKAGYNHGIEDSFRLRKELQRVRAGQKYYVLWGAFWLFALQTAVLYFII